jgi:hypothetical protein
MSLKGGSIRKSFTTTRSSLIFVPNTYIDNFQKKGGAVAEPETILLFLPLEHRKK